MITIDDLQERVHKTAVSKGWWKLYGETHPEQVDSVTANAIDPNSRNMGEMLMLMVTEIVEAMEESRVHDIHDIYWVDELGRKHLYDSMEDAITGAFKGQKPEGFFVELADCVIRIMDTMYVNGAMLGEYIVLKDIFNKTRPYRHGDKKS